MRINQLGDHKVPRKPEVIKRIKNTNTIAAKMKVVVERMIQSYKTNETRPLLTIFVYKSLQSEIISSFLHEMQKENVTLFANKDRKSTRLNSSHIPLSRMPSSA